MKLLIHRWERMQREQREIAKRLEIERRRHEAMRQAAQQKSEAVRSTVRPGDGA